MQIGDSGRDQKLAMAELWVDAALEPGHSILLHVDRHPDRIVGRSAGLGTVEPDDVGTKRSALGLSSFGSR